MAFARNEGGKGARASSAKSTPDPMPLRFFADAPEDREPPLPEHRLLTVFTEGRNTPSPNQPLVMPLANGPPPAFHEAGRRRRLSGIIAGGGERHDKEP